MRLTVRHFQVQVLFMCHRGLEDPRHEPRGTPIVRAGWSPPACRLVSPRSQGRAVKLSEPRTPNRATAWQPSLPRATCPTISCNTHRAMLPSGSYEGQDRRPSSFALHPAPRKGSVAGSRVAPLIHAQSRVRTWRPGSRDTPTPERRTISSGMRLRAPRIAGRSGPGCMPVSFDRAERRSPACMALHFTLRNARVEASGSRSRGCRTIDPRLHDPLPTGAFMCAVHRAGRSTRGSMIHYPWVHSCAVHVAGRSTRGSMIHCPWVHSCAVHVAGRSARGSMIHCPRVHSCAVCDAGRSTRGRMIHYPRVHSCAVHRAGRSTRGCRVQKPCLHSHASQGGGRWTRGCTTHEHRLRSYEASSAS